MILTGKHDVYMDQITLSGFSSGATFAQQMFISHSALFTGIASFSHGKSNGLIRINTCVNCAFNLYAVFVHV